MKPVAPQRRDRVPRYFPSQKRRKLRPRNRLKISNRHEDQRVRLGELAGFRPAERGADRRAEAGLRPKTPSSGDIDDLVGSAAQFFADVVDDQFDLARFPHHVRQGFPRDRLGGGEDHRFDALKPFAPARGAAEIFEIEIEFLLVLSRSRHRSQPVEAERRPAGQFAQGAEGHEPFEQPPRAALGKPGDFRRGAHGIVVEQGVQRRRGSLSP